LERSGGEKSYLEGKVEENRGTVDFLLANLGQKFSSTKNKKLKICGLDLAAKNQWCGRRFYLP
jgi:hypothetical protein